MHYTYNTSGTCSKAIDFDVEDGVIVNVKFTGGCNGNLKGIGKLVEGMKVEEVAQKLKGIQCGPRSTSCPDQLAKACEAYINNKQ
ncbi:MAG: TIGR03905 family TSCPD domain-containing protein [Clostridia bacterium]|nr:TIGR03905 family TSCPD domain-containing protein [Clostridia bacterium]